MDPETVEVKDQSEEGIFEIVEEQPAEPPKDPMQGLKELYESQKKEVDAARGEVQGTQAAIGEGFSKLSDSIKSLVESQRVQPGESLEDFKKRVEKSVFDKPIDVMQEVLLKTQGPLNEQIVSTQMKMGKKLVRLDLEAGEKELFNRYDAEIDAEFAKIPIQERFADPEESYRRAFDLTKARHLKEIISEAQAKTPPKPPTPAGIVEGTQKTPAVAPQNVTTTKKITLKPGQRGRIEAMMARENVAPHMFNSVVESFYDQGILDQI